MHFPVGNYIQAALKKENMTVQILNSRERAWALKFGSNWEVTEPLRSMQLTGSVPFQGTAGLWLFSRFSDS